MITACIGLLLGAITARWAVWPLQGYLAARQVRRTRARVDRLLEQLGDPK